MTGIIGEDETHDLASVLVPELSAQHPDAIPLAAAARVLFDAASKGDLTLARKVAQFAAMMWDYGDEDVRAEVTFFFIHGLLDSLGDTEPNEALVAALTNDQRQHLEESSRARQ